LGFPLVSHDERILTHDADHLQRVIPQSFPVEPHDHRAGQLTQEFGSAVAGNFSLENFAVAPGLHTLNEPLVPFPIFGLYPQEQTFPADEDYVGIHDAHLLRDGLADALLAIDQAGNRFPLTAFFVLRPYDTRGEDHRRDKTHDMFHTPPFRRGKETKVILRNHSQQETYQNDPTAKTNT
jgi:hypothetical protein